MNGLPMSAEENCYSHTADLDGTGQKLAQYLSKIYGGIDVKGYISSALDLVYSIQDRSVRKYLVDKFMGKDISADRQKRASDYFYNNSFITRSVRAFRGTHVLTEALYEGNINPDEHPLDYYITRMPSSQATRQRLLAVKEELERAIKQAVKYENPGTVEVVNWGSGFGRDTIDIAHKLKGTPYGEAIRVTLVDKDAAALKKGEERAERMGVLSKFSFEEKDLKAIIKRKSNRRYNIGLLIGILCPMDLRSSKVLVKGLSSHLSNNGCLIISSSADEMLRDDPFLDFLRQEEGFWPLIYKGRKDIEGIYRYAGFNGSLHFFRDSPWGHHIMCTGYLENP